VHPGALGECPAVQAAERAGSARLSVDLGEELGAAGGAASGHEFTFLG
jgi:hypothetical protein